MEAQTFQKTDDGMMQLLQALDTQITNMKTSHNTVINIQSDLAVNHKSDSATQFHSKVDQWLESYNTVISQVWELTDSLNISNNILNDSAQQALQSASGWSPTSGATFDVLTNW